MPSRDAKRRQLAGSQRGAEAVRNHFAAVITRKAYCDLVGIHPTTLRRWERLGVVTGRSETVLSSPTTTFTEADVTFGRRVVALLRERPGQLSLAEAAAIARE